MVLFSIFKTILCFVSFFHICPEQDGTTDAPTDAPTVLSCPTGEIKATLTYPGDQCEEGDTFKYAFAGEAGPYLEVVDDDPSVTNVDTLCLEDDEGATYSFLVTPCADSDAMAITLSIPTSCAYGPTGGLGTAQLCSGLEDCDEADYKYRRLFITQYE